MKHLIKVFAFFAVMCLGAMELSAQTIDLTPVRDKKTGLYAFKDVDGNLVTDYIYEDVYLPIDCDDGSFFYVKKQEKIGVVNNQGVEIIPCEFEYYGSECEYYGSECEDLLLFKKNGREGFVDFSGKTVVPFIYESCWFGMNSENDGLVNVEKNGKSGILSLKERKEIIPCVYEEIYMHDDVCVAKKDGKYGLVNLKNETVVPFLYDNYDYHYSSDFCVEKSGKYGIVDYKTGKTVVPIKYKFASTVISKELYRVGNFSGKETLLSYRGKQLCGWYDKFEYFYEERGIAIFKQNGKYGLLDWKHNKEVVSAKYDKINKLSGNKDRVIFCQNGKYGVLDLTSLKEVVSAKYDSFDSPQGRRIKFLQNKKTGILDLDSYEEILPATHLIFDCCQVNEKFLPVYEDHRVGYLNTETGKLAFDCVFDEAEKFSEGSARVKKNGKYGVIKENGSYLSLLIPCVWDYCSDRMVVENRIAVQKNGKNGCINTDGELIIPCMYDDLSLLDLYILVRVDEKWGCLDYNGNEIVPCLYKERIARFLAKAYFEKEGPSDVDENIFSTPTTNNETFAVIIANQDYTEHSSVDFAINDGKIFKEYCTKTLGIPGRNIRYRENATLNNMRSDVNWLKGMTAAHGSNAKVIFYYAGHGIPDEKNGNSYLLPVDGMGNDVRSGYSLSELYDELGKLSAKQITVLMDACFSGAKRDGDMLVAARGVAIRAKSAAPQGNMVVLSAAQGDETAYQFGKKKHGMFTYFLLKKLQSTKGDVTLQELAKYVKEQVMQHSMKENGKRQTPTMQVSHSLQSTINNRTL